MKPLRRDDPTSFDLILDIMCNAFGGMIFIALLLTLLSQTVSVTQTREESASDASDSREISVSQKKGGAASDMERDERHLIRTIDLGKNENRKLELTLLQLEKEIQLLGKRVEKREVERQRAVRYPKLHPIGKQPVFIALKNNRLYPISDLSKPYRQSRHRGYDLSHVKRWEEGEGTVIDPMPGRGEAIHVDAMSKTEDALHGISRGRWVHALLTHVDTHNEFVSFAVYPDAFEAFIKLKSLCVESGLDYNWILVKDRLSIVTRKEGMGSHHVQ